MGTRALAGDLKCWIAQDLAMVTNGLSQVAGADADTTRLALAKEVGTRALAGDLKCWIAQDLAMVTNGLSHCLYAIGEDVVQALIKAMMKMLPTKKQIMTALNALCRLSLLHDQLELGYLLVKSFYDTTDYIEADILITPEYSDLLWCLAVLDLCRTENPLVTGDIEIPYLDIFFTPLMEGERVTGIPSDRWQHRFAYIYWMGIDHSDFDVSIVFPAPEKNRKTSSLQKRVYQSIKEALPNSVISMEVEIEGFPVDILVDNKLCIEVDGPQHFIQEHSMEAEEQVLQHFPGKERARYRLIDHILKRLSFDVMRISYVEAESDTDLETFAGQVKKVINEQEISNQLEGLSLIGSVAKSDMVQIK